MREKSDSNAVKPDAGEPKKKRIRTRKVAVVPIVDGRDEAPLTETIGEELGTTADELAAVTSAIPAKVKPTKVKKIRAAAKARVPSGGARGEKAPVDQAAPSTRKARKVEPSSAPAAREKSRSVPAGNKLLDADASEVSPRFEVKTVNKLTTGVREKRKPLSGKLSGVSAHPADAISANRVSPVTLNPGETSTLPATIIETGSVTEKGPVEVVRVEEAETSSPALIPATAAGSTSLLTENDLYLFNEGTHRRLYEKLGAHLVQHEGVEGTYFAVWAPSAVAVSVIGDFNGWKPGVDRLSLRGVSGVWDGFLAGIGAGTVYKYSIVSANGGKSFEKADPFGFAHECPPETASTVSTLGYAWGDDEWMRNRATRIGLNAPMSTYEVHLGSWRRPENPEEFLSYRELAQPLADYVRQVGFTHVEFMPVMEHPFFGSWGYQSTGYFAPSSRFGSPTDFMYLVDVLHQNGIGVLLDWVPSHFPSDAHGLAYFDGTHLFEHEDPRKGFQPDWGSLIFNYGRHEVRSFLISSAIYWLDVYHADGLRVDAVASMLYLDYSRKPGQWVPNKFGGRENLEAVAFLRQLNEAVYSEMPDVQVIAEESTAWPLVSRPAYVGGLGFGMKWDMGWMHDTLEYMAQDPIHRRFHHGKLTFRPIYAFTENFVLPISHDEVVHGKGSLIRKMRGDEWQRFANLRLLLAYMWAVPGKKLLFMGCEFGQWNEWNHDSSLDWDSLKSPFHRGVQHLVGDLNRIYKETPALSADFDPAGFQWIDANDSDQSVISFLRLDSRGNAILCAFNFTPRPRYNYQLGVPRGGDWKEIMNSDAPMYGGSGQGNLGAVEASPLPLHGRRSSVTITLPPLGAVYLMSAAPLVTEDGIAGATNDAPDQDDDRGDRT